MHERKLWYRGDCPLSVPIENVTSGLRPETRRTDEIISAIVADRPDTTSFVTIDGGVLRAVSTDAAIQLAASCA